MTFEFQPVRLDVRSGDDTGVLVLRDGALFAVAAQLGNLHADDVGSWFVEAVFDPSFSAPREPFPTLEALESWLQERLG
jgi:hypothetical protein